MTDASDKDDWSVSGIDRCPKRRSHKDLERLDLNILPSVERKGS